jgi:hypothetical protein
MLSPNVCKVLGQVHKVVAILLNKAREEGQHSRSDEYKCNDECFATMQVANSTWHSNIYMMRSFDMLGWDGMWCVRVVYVDIAKNLDGTRGWQRRERRKVSEEKGSGGDLHVPSSYSFLCACAPCTRD